MGSLENIGMFFRKLLSFNWSELSRWTIPSQQFARSGVRFLGHFVATGSLASAGALSAQVIPAGNIPDPLRVEQSLRSAPDPVPAAPYAAISVGEKVNDDTQQLRFVFRGLQIEGAVALSESDLRNLWEHDPGSEISVAEVFGYADRISKAYAKQGYALSFALVPQQEIKDGIVNIRVIEGFVDNVSYTGTSLPSGLWAGTQGTVAAHLARVSAQRPVSAAALERSLLLINDIPGIAARATFAPAAQVLGGSQLTLDVKSKRFSGEFGYNSYMPPALGRHVVGGSLALNNLVTGVDRFRVSGWHSVNNAAYWNVSGDYLTLVGTEGLSLSASASYGRMRPNAALLRAIDYAGTAFSGNVSMRYPLTRSRRDNLAVEVGVSMLDTDADYLAGSLLRDRLRKADVAMTFETTDALGAASVVRIELSQGLDLPGSGGDSRAFGTNDFAIANISIQRLQPLISGSGGRVDLLMSVFGQHSLRGPLLSSVECSYGGRRFGRRFDAGELSGDHCAMGGFELRWGKFLQNAGLTWFAQLYSFADGGVVRQQGTLIPGERREQRMASAGAGIRLDINNRVLSNLELSLPVHRPNDLVNGGSLRISGGVTVRF
jgi:hemolysin activation/secretion protein